MDDDLIEQRFELVDDRFSHVDKRIEALEQAHNDHAVRKETRHSRFVNWLMLGLFIVEVAIGVAELWMLRHA